MKDLINFQKDEKYQKVVGKIRLGEFVETFFPSFLDWTEKDYEKQWHHAIKHSLDKRELSCLFLSYEKSDRHVKKISIITIIPEEFVTRNLAIADEEDEEDLGFYMTECLVFVSENLESLKSDEDFEEIYNVYKNNSPIYFLDLKKLERFYLYMSCQIQGISHWYISKEELGKSL